MKKIIYISILLFSVFGCREEFLDKVPTTSSVVENFYTTPEEGKQALTAVYNMLLRDDWWSLYLFSEIANDCFAGGAGSADGGGFQQIDRCLQWADVTAHQNHWNNYWGAIYRANLYLENEQKIDWTGSEVLRTQYQAEARFLRAYFHYYLTQMFGLVPALDHTISPAEIPSRSTAEELYGLIIDDLKFAAENALPAKYGEADQADYGRVTKWAAKAMLSRVYLYYSGYYNQQEINGFKAQDALAAIEDVINNSGYNLVPEFASLWKVPCVSELGSLDAYAGEKNQEVIWSIIYVEGGGSSTYGGNWFSRMIGPRNYNTDPYGQGWGAIPVTPKFWQSFTDGDKRKKATILSWNDEGYTYDYLKNEQAQYTGYNMKKYQILSVDNKPAITGDWQTNNDEDYIVIRFADVLLMGAELKAIVSGENDATALSYLNRVRERAFGNSSKNYSKASIENILEERKFELAGENSRYWDILRSCKGDFSKLTTLLTYVDDTDDGDFSNDPAAMHSLDVDGNNFARTKGLFQIPKAELDLMGGVIEQNEGYN